MRDYRNTENVRKTKYGLDRNLMTLIGLLLLALGAMGRGIIQTRFLGMGSVNSDQLLEILSASGGMQAAAAALVFEGLESCAAPIFAVLLVDGFRKSSDPQKYILRVLGVAILSEIPYNYVFSGKFLDMTSRNPVWAMVLGLLMLYLFNQYRGRQFSRCLIKLAVAAAAILWTLLFRVQFGPIMLLLVMVLWIMRDRPTLRLCLGAAVAVCCCVMNPLYMFSPFGFLIAHFYNEKKGFFIRPVQYLMYPLMLVLVGLAGFIMTL